MFQYASGMLILLFNFTLAIFHLDYISDGKTDIEDYN